MREMAERVVERISPSKVLESDLRANVIFLKACDVCELEVQDWYKGLRVNFQNRIYVVLDEESCNMRGVRALCNKGFHRFITQESQDMEFKLALYQPIKRLRLSPDEMMMEIEEICRVHGCYVYQDKDYNMDFKRHVFEYRGKSIYLPLSAQRYCANLMIAGHKDNFNRSIISKVRKYAGQGFLNGFKPSR